MPGMPSHAATGETISRRYVITFKDGTRKSFAVEIDAETLSLVPKPRSSYPDWTRLGFRQCPNCPLEDARHERCPVAANLADVVESFAAFPSYEDVDVAVESENRTYTRHGALQTAASSLIGLYMVTSGCPILDRLRPLVDMHLPFMNRRETVYRMVSMYVMAQFFRQKAGETADWELTGLVRCLEEIRTVNVSFCERLRAIEAKDASVNALVILSMLGDVPSRLVTKKDLARLERIYRRHW
jgi:hypothetical protein